MVPDLKKFIVSQIWRKSSRERTFWKLEEYWSNRLSTIEQLSWPQVTNYISILAPIFLYVYSQELHYPIDSLCVTMVSNAIFRLLPLVRFPTHHDESLHLLLVQSCFQIDFLLPTSWISLIIHSSHI